MKYIDDDKTHVQVLYELGILDDDDNWELYKKMQDEQLKCGPDDDDWHKYMNTIPLEIPKDMPWRPGP